MALMSLTKKWLAVAVIAIALLLLPTSSLDIEPSYQRPTNAEPSLSSSLDEIRDEAKPRQQRTDKISNQIDEKVSQTQASTEDQLYGWLNSGRKESSNSCGIECLECENGECKRFNWIGVICLVMLVINLLAIAYCILLIRKRQGRSVTKDSLLTQGSVYRSVEVD